MNHRLRIGLVGCGRAAEKLYIPALAALQAEAQVTAVADPLAERRELLASHFVGSVTFDSVEALLESADLDAVIITTPPDTHVAVAALALQAGIPALVEKPLAPSLDGIDELEALAKSSPGWLMVGFNRRYWKPVRQLRQVMSVQPKPRAVRAQMTMISNMQAWAPVSCAADPLDDLSSHQLDLAHYIFDRPIVAVCARRPDQTSVSIQLRLGDNAVVDCFAKHGTPSQEAILVEYEGRQFRIDQDLGSERLYPANGPVRKILDYIDSIKRRCTGESSSLRKSYEQQLRSFFDHIHTGTLPQSDLASGISIIRAVEAAKQSAALQGKEILI